MRTKGAKGGGTEKTENGKVPLPFQPPAPAGVYLFRHQPAGFQKGPVGGSTLSTAHWGDQAQKLALVHRLWACSPEGFLPMCKLAFRNLPLH